MTISRFLWLIALLTPLNCAASNPDLYMTDLGFKPDSTIALSDSPLYLSANTTASLQPLPLGVSRRNAPDQRLFPHLDLPTEPDWDGLKQDSKLFLLYQVAMVGIIYFLPESTSQWDEDKKKGNLLRKWDDNVTSVRKDKDDWAINYIGHPYFGAVYYVRARHRGFNRQGSFWYAVTMSTLYEYGIEAIFEPVSIQDLIFTPVGGAIMGEYFMLSREKIKRNIAARGYATRADNFKLFMTDPLGALNRTVNRFFGNKEDEARLGLMPLVAHTKLTDNPKTYLGLQAHYSW